MEGSSIARWRPEEELPPQSEPESSLLETIAEDGPGERVGWMARALAAVVVLAWLAGMLWLARGRLAGLAPEQLAQFIAALCVPPALLGIGWLLAMRSSRREARRFAASANAMRSEAASLERTVGMLTTRIDAGRIELASQTTSLLALGADASERIAALGSDMTREVAAVGAHTLRLVDTATRANASLEGVVAALPRAHAETAAMAATLDATAAAARLHATELEQRIAALGEAASAAHATVDAAAGQLSERAEHASQLSEAARLRLEKAATQLAAQLDAALSRSGEAVDAQARTLARHAEAAISALQHAQSAMDRTANEGAAALDQRVGGIAAAVTAIGQRLEEQDQAAGTLLAQLLDGISDVDARFEALHRLGTERAQSLAASISALAQSADAMTEALKVGDTTARSAIGTAEDLLTALDASAREIDETLPEALSRLDARIAESRAGLGAAKPELLALVTAAESTHAAIAAVGHVVAEQRTELEELARRLDASLADGVTRAGSLTRTVGDVIDASRSFADDVVPRLSDALGDLGDQAARVASTARETLSAAIPASADALEHAAAAALRRAAAVSVERQVAAIAEAADAAAEAAARASDRLARQMLVITEATAAVERRIEDARSERETAARNSFARRAGALVESLNSAAIDIARGLSSDVSDSAWTAYLKGDRGVFTRRAVRLLDGGAARDVAKLYHEDPAFREQVNRYIHDFEAMLRDVLSEDDPSPLAVTLLSSDMGKLYVAMAQAIERLRT